jgi:hypothetical protein
MLKRIITAIAMAAMSFPGKIYGSMALWSANVKWVIGLAVCFSLLAHAPAWASEPVEQNGQIEGVEDADASPPSQKKIVVSVSWSRWGYWRMQCRRNRRKREARKRLRKRLIQ